MPPRIRKAAGATTPVQAIMHASDKRPNIPTADGQWGLTPFLGHGVYAAGTSVVGGVLLSFS